MFDFVQSMWEREFRNESVRQGCDCEELLKLTVLANRLSALLNRLLYTVLNLWHTHQAVFASSFFFSVGFETARLDYLLVL